MNKIFSYTLILLFPLLLIISGCVESLNSPDKIAPIIELYKPANNDTLIIGKRTINYYASDDQRLDYIELWVNNKFLARTSANSDGSFPVVEWDVDTSLAYKFISYYLVAFDKGGNSTPSKQMTNIWVTFDTKPPKAPRNLVLRKISPTAVNLAWEDSSDNEKGFKILRKKEKDAAYTEIQSVAGNVTSTNDLTLDGSSVYYYKVVSWNDYGSAESNEVSTTGALELPVYNVVATPLGKSHIRLTWSTNSASKLGFEIQRKSSISYYAQVGFAISTTFDDTVGLTAGMTYAYKIAARYQNGTSDWSEEVWVTTLSQDILPPSGLTANLQSGGTKVVLSWTNNMSAKETRIERSSNLSGPFTEIGKVDNNILSFTDSAVTTQNTYYYRVRNLLWATNDFSPYSNVAQITIVVTPPNAPSNLTIRVFSDNPKKFNLVWTDNSNDEEGFELWRQDGPAGTFRRIKYLDANTISTNDTVPTAGIVYYYKVRAFRGNTYSDFSSTENTSGSSNTIAKPTNIRYTATKNSVTVMWDYTSSSNILGFEIERINYDGSTLEPYPITDASARQYVDSYNLLTYNIYKYRVRASTNQGYSDWSDRISVTIPANQNLGKKR